MYEQGHVNWKNKLFLNFLKKKTKISDGFSDQHKSVAISKYIFGDGIFCD